VTLFSSRSALRSSPSLTKSRIETTFTRLETAHREGFASFSKETTGHNSSWEYRIVFAFPNPGDDQDFYSLVTTIYLTADIADESAWWGIQSSTSHNFGAKVTAMQLVVTKGFKDPVKPVSVRPGAFLVADILPSLPLRLIQRLSTPTPSSLRTSCRRADR
jgi:hypothetical protein